MRERFEKWGAGLSNADFACALAAVGVLPEEASYTWSAERLATEIWNEAFTIDRGVSGLLWRFKDWSPWFDPRVLVEAWQLAKLRFHGQIAILVDVRSLKDEGVDPRWIVMELWRREVGAARVALWNQTRESFEQGAYSVGGDDSHRGAAWGSRTQQLSNEQALRKALEVLQREPPRRWLQARLRSGSRDLETLRGIGSYEAVIRIGEADARWVSVEQPFPTPEEPPEPEGHRLTVIFWEPRVSPDPQVQPLLLPPEGNTREISFPFQVLEGLEKIAARITVLHANRVLQTGVLRAEIGGPWTFTLDATPRTRLEGLSGRTEFDLALILNHDDEGTARATMAAGGEAVVIPLGESSVNGLTKALSEQISKIARAPELYETLRSAGTEELLLILAQKGGGLHRILSKGYKVDRLTSPDAMGRPPCIHLTSALPDSFLPAELLYRFQVPDDTATLCEHASAGLAAGACPPQCPADKRGTVCPLGFWGLSCIIERHSYLGEHEKPATGYQLQRPEPVLKRNELEVSAKALLAASDAASKHEKGAVQSLLEKLRSRGPAELVTSWKDWSARLAADRPTLLVLLPHHERKGSFEILEIGASDPLKSEHIEDVQHVRISEQDKPIVVLMGCDTNLARIAFDNFVTRFITEGAAIVVSTIATILGRHASPATARLIELLDEEALDGNSSFGEVMLRLRRSLFLEQTPMALGLTAYGDADWILTRKADALHRDAPRPLR